MNERKALLIALPALKNAYWPSDSNLMPAHNVKECAKAITAIEEALAQPEHKPWVGLTEEERDNIINQAYDDYHDLKISDTDLEMAKNIEAKLMDKNS